MPTGSSPVRIHDPGSTESGQFDVLVIGGASTVAPFEEIADPDLRVRVIPIGGRDEILAGASQRIGADDIASRLGLELGLLRRLGDVQADLVVLSLPDLSAAMASRVAAVLDRPYVLIVSPDVRPPRARDWPLFNSARRRLLLPGADASLWRSSVIFSMSELARGDASEYSALLLHLSRGLRAEELDSRLEAPPRDNASVSVRLFSYFMPPCSSVAMHRLAYWHEELAGVGKSVGLEFHVDVVTASDGPDHDPSVHVVPDHGLEHPLGESAEPLMSVLHHLGINPLGATWSAYVRAALDDLEACDVAILSGNPFFHFDLASDLQRRGTKVILDFRDPFANNPRFEYSDEQRAFLQELETSYALTADAVASVNATCLDLVAPSVTTRRIVLANGYDERAAEQVAPARGPVRDDRITIVYAGTFYADRDPATLISALDPRRHELIHVGRSGVEEPSIESSSCARQLGPKTYADTLAILKAADVGLVMTSGEPFEQTTKIFDYVAAGLDVLIVTSGEPETGELHELTRDLDRVHWVRNEASDIKAFLRSFEPSPASPRGGRHLSRRAQAEELAHLIAELTATDLPDHGREIAP